MSERCAELIAMEKRAVEAERRTAVAYAAMRTEWRDMLARAEKAEAETYTAEPVEDWKPCCLQHPHHVHCCHPERRTTTIDRRRGYEHTYQADSDYYGTKHVRWYLAGLDSGPQRRTGQRRKS